MNPFVYTKQSRDSSDKWFIHRKKYSSSPVVADTEKISLVETSKKESWSPLKDNVTAPFQKPFHFDIFMPEDVVKSDEKNIWASCFIVSRQWWIWSPRHMVNNNLMLFMETLSQQSKDHKEANVPANIHTGVAPRFISFFSWVSSWISSPKTLNILKSY